MERIKNFWRQKQLYEKVLSLMGVICSISIIILVIIRVLNIWKYAINVFEPLLGLLMLIQGCQSLRKNKIVAIFSFGVAIFIFLVAVFILVIR